MYSCNLSLTSALDGGGWSTPGCGRFTPGEETLYPEARWAPGVVWTSAENVAPTGIRSRTSSPQQVAILTELST